MREKKVFKKAFRLNEYGFADFPTKISNVKIARLEFGIERGCSWCFPHGWETSNATLFKNRRTWKYHRAKQWKPNLQ